MSKDRTELDLYFRLMGEPADLGPKEAAEARARKEQVLLKRSPLAYRALLLARDTLRSIKPADTLLLLPRTAVACLALLEAFNDPELTLEIRSTSESFIRYPMVGFSQIVLAGGGGGGAACGGHDTLVSGGNGVGGCGGGGATPEHGSGHASANSPDPELLDIIRANLLKNQESYARQR